MYEQYFGFTRTPFRLESEPDMFFFGESQENVLECIKASLAARKSILTLSGLPGSGKTTVMRKAIEASIVPDTIICRINRARCDDFLSTLRLEIGQRLYPEMESFQDSTVEQFVKDAISRKKHILIVIDESQQLTEIEVEYIFNLVNIEESELHFFKFLLVSHEPFHDYFDIERYIKNDSQVPTHCFLLPLLNNEILPYIKHRLTNTGWATGKPSFIDEIEEMVFLITQGIPRRINSFFDRLMLFAYFESCSVIDLKFVKRFCCDLLLELEEESHPDLDSFDLRQVLRREKRLFLPQNSVAKTSKTDQNSIVKKSMDNESVNLDSDTDALSKPRTRKTAFGEMLIDDEPLATEDPVALILFVSRFIQNPERFKNYSDLYYKLPKNLTLLLCLAIETDQYIRDVTPESINDYSPDKIKGMIVEFIRRVLITSRPESFRSLGLDENANEDEINRHFSYMMQICRSSYVTELDDNRKLEAIVKDAYINLIQNFSSADDDFSAGEGGIPELNKIVKIKDELKPIDNAEIEPESIFINGSGTYLENNDSKSNFITAINPNEYHSESAVKDGAAEKQTTVFVQSSDEVENTSNDIKTVSDDSADAEKSTKTPLLLFGGIAAATIVVAVVFVFSGEDEQITNIQTDVVNSVAMVPAESDKLIIKPGDAEEFEQLELLVDRQKVEQQKPKSDNVKPPANATTNTSKDIIVNKSINTSVKTVNQNKIKQKEQKEQKEIAELKVDPEITRLVTAKSVPSNNTRLSSNTLVSKTTKFSDVPLSAETQALMASIELELDKEEQKNKSDTKPIETTNQVEIKITSESILKKLRGDDRVASKTNDAAVIITAEKPPVEIDVNEKVVLAGSETVEQVVEFSANEMFENGVEEPGSKNSERLVEDNTSKNNLVTEFELVEAKTRPDLSEPPAVLAGTTDTAIIDGSDRIASVTGAVDSELALKIVSNVESSKVDNTSVDTIVIPEVEAVFAKYSKSALERLINDFKFSYATGDIDEFSTLFAADAVTNDGFNLEQITDDYEILFDETETRNINFIDISWGLLGDVAFADGKFEVSIQDEEDEEFKDVQGRITIKVQEIDEVLKIKELYFLYQFAGVE